MYTPFGHYLRIKPQDNILIILFAKANKSSLTKVSTAVSKYFCEPHLHYILLNTLFQADFGCFFENVTPWTASNISKLIVNFKS